MPATPTLTDNETTAYIDRWLRNPDARCGFCGGHTTECASAAALSVGRRFAIPCGA